MAFDTLRATQRLRERGVDESLAEGVVEVVAEATRELVTRDHFDARMAVEREYLDTRFAVERQYLDIRLTAEIQGLRAEMYRALTIQGGVILAGVGVIVALAETLN